jgi:hypothetical protein
MNCKTLETEKNRQNWRGQINRVHMRNEKLKQRQY